MVVDIRLRYSANFGRLLLELVGRSCEKGFASAEEAQFTGFAAGLVQDTLSGQHLGLGPRSEAENTVVWSLAESVLGLFDTHTVHSRELGKSLGIHDPAFMFRLFILVCLQDSLESFNIVVEAFGVGQENFAVDLVPIGWVFGRDNLALSMGNVSFDDVDPELVSFANDLGRVSLYLSLQKG